MTVVEATGIESRIRARRGRTFQPPNSARLLWTHLGVLWRVTRNDLAARYAGSLLGSTWAALSPLMILAIYAVTYLFIFRVRVPGLTSAQYVVYIFSGLVPYLATAEALAVGVGSVVANKSVLSSTVFPIDLVPVKAVLTSQVTLAVGLVVTLVGAAATGSLSGTALLVPVVILLHGLGCVGAAWILALLNVVFRDLQNVINVFLMVMLLASPIAYVPSMVPGRLKLFLLLNPFAYLVTAYQKLLVLGEVPGPGHWAALSILCVGLFFAGAAIFSRGKRVIADYV